MAAGRVLSPCRGGVRLVVAAWGVPGPPPAFLDKCGCSSNRDPRLPCRIVGRAPRQCSTSRRGRSDDPRVLVCRHYLRRHSLFALGATVSASGTVLFCGYLGGFSLELPEVCSPACDGSSPV